MGFRVESGELFTAVSAAAAWCREAGHDRVLALLPEETLEDLAGLSIETPWRPALPADGRVGAVVVGDLGEGWSYEVLNAAFQRLMAGAALVACQKNRYWKTGDGLALDAGPFVAALEYAARAEAVVTGKPSEVLFRSALGGLGVQPREAVMVGDDAEIDVGGAIAAGLAGWLVKTGKYRPGDESRASPWPECVLGSVAELPEALGIE
jgi:HAD superfamily hydrolase (TIGR01458 family)